MKIMGALRHVTNWLRLLRERVVPTSINRLINRLKPSSQSLKKKIVHRCSPLVKGAQEFLPLENSVAGSVSSNSNSIDAIGTEAASANADSNIENHANRQTAGANIGHYTRSKAATTRRRSNERRSCSRRSTGHTLLRSSVGSRRIWIVTLLAVLLLATSFGQRFYWQPTLDIRSTAPQSFYAPTSAVVEDKKATESRREAVRSGLVQVLQIDPEQTATAKRSLNTLLQQGRRLRNQAGDTPLLNLETLSQATQDFLFQATEDQWQRVWRLAKKPDLSAAQIQAVANSAEDQTEEALDEIDSELYSLLPIQQLALQELIAYRELYDLPKLAQLQIRLENRRQQYQRNLETLAAEASTEGQSLYNYRLFELSEEQWNKLGKTSRTLFNDMMLQGISVGTPDDLLRRAVESRLASEPDTAVRELTADFLLASLVPNLIIDEERTRQQAEQAVGQIDPVMLSIDQGDLIVGAGDSIDATDFVLLDYFGLTDRYFNWVGLCGFSVLIACAVAFYLWVDHLQVNQLNQRDHLLVLLLCLGVSVLAALRVPTIGLPAVGLLVGSFYGNTLGVTVVGLLALILPIGTEVMTIPLIAGAAAALLGTWIAPQLRSREEFALLGGFVGLSQATVHFILTLMRLTIAAPLWKSIFIGSALHGVYGVAWSVLALGVSPYLEHFFDVVTPIRLAELANPNRPLLKRLAAEAPGTFQHTMFVANLAESGARALGRNVELVRAGTLYHDIGKMHDPQSFIENQMGGPNKHDEINDPWVSAGIIRKHVTQGLVMAKKYRLPQAVQAFIPEHQGDMKISYFYQQAKQRQEKEPSLVVNESDFSYDGPIPQSPETGITMLADSCEAALRSLKPEASIDEAYTLVNRILRARWRSRQLIDSGLSRDDMDVIASVFIQVWQQHNHKRIEYPKNALV